MIAAYLTLFVLILTPWAVNGRPSAPGETLTREPRQLIVPVGVSLVRQPVYGYPQYYYGQNPLFSMYGPQFNNPIQERFGFALLSLLFGGGGEGGDGDDGGEGDDGGDGGEIESNRNPWLFRPLAFLQRPFSSSMGVSLN